MKRWPYETWDGFRPQVHITTIHTDSVQVQHPSQKATNLHFPVANQRDLQFDDLKQQILLSVIAGQPFSPTNWGCLDGRYTTIAPTRSQQLEPLNPTVDAVFATYYCCKLFYSSKAPILSDACMLNEMPRPTEEIIDHGQSNSTKESNNGRKTKTTHKPKSLVELSSYFKAERIFGTRDWREKKSKTIRARTKHTTTITA